MTLIHTEEREGFTRAIKIDEEHTAAIQAALDAVNRRASEHVFTNAQQIIDAARVAEARLLAVVGYETHAPRATDTYHVNAEGQA